MIRKILCSFLLLSMFVVSCNDEPANTEEEGTETPAPVTTGLITFSIEGTRPHDTGYFTEGLEFHEGRLYESSGSGTDAPGTGVGPYPSSFGVVDSATGKVDPKVTLDKNQFFGEGITFFKGKIYQLTYTTKKGFVYDAKTYQKIKEFSIPAAEGWGLTHDSASIIMSVGTNQLYYLDPETLGVKNILSVFDNNGPANSRLNELEYINGFIYANEWLTNYIAKIDPSSGKIVGRLDLSRIVAEAAQRNPNGNEMNGIAYDSVENIMLVTGKNWPVFYKIRMKP